MFPWIFKDPQLIQQTVGLPHQGKFQGKPCRVRGFSVENEKKHQRNRQFWQILGKSLLGNSLLGEIYVFSIPWKNYGNIWSTWVLAVWIIVYFHNVHPYLEVLFVEDRFLKILWVDDLQQHRLYNFIPLKKPTHPLKNKERDIQNLNISPPKKMNRFFPNKINQPSWVDRARLSEDHGDFGFGPKVRCFQTVGWVYWRAYINWGHNLQP